MSTIILALITMLFITVTSAEKNKEVTYDSRSLIINGKRELLFSGSVHYTRSPPEVPSSSRNMQKLLYSESLRNMQLNFINFCCNIKYSTPCYVWTWGFQTMQQFLGINKWFSRVRFQMWPLIIDKARRGGLNVIQTYIFWNVHEPVEGKVIVSGTRSNY